MAREIVTWCDPCMERDERTPGREHTVSLDGATPKVLALCGPHEEEHFKPLLALLAEFGAPTEPRTRPSDKPRHLLDFEVGGSRRGRTPEDGNRKAQCLWCPLTFSGDNSGLTQHVEKIHGLSRSLRETFGPECPLCGNAFDLLGGHVKKSHGCDSITEAFLQAKDAGDPHGIYAKVIARAEVLT